MEALTEYPTDLIQGAGRNIYLAFRKWVELEDCQQEAWVCYLTYREEFDKHIFLGETAYVAKAIRNWVADYCRRQKAIICGYQAEDEAFYSRRRARTMLELFLHSEHPPEGGLRMEGRVKNATTDGTDRHVELLDVSRAWNALDQASRDVLWLAYGPEEPPPGTWGALDRQKAQRALSRLVDILNGAA